jgi:hypothetical protein
MSASKELEIKMNEWVKTRMDDAVFDPKKGYYPFSVIADAYEKGVELGEKYLKDNIKETFQKNMKLVSQAINDINASFKEYKYVPRKLFIKLGIKESKILFSFDEELYLTDQFLDVTYNLASDIRTKSFDEGICLSVGFLIDSDKLNLEELRSDGFGIGIDLKSKKQII